MKAGKLFHRGAAGICLGGAGPGHLTLEEDVETIPLHASFSARENGLHQGRPPRELRLGNLLLSACLLFMKKPVTPEAHVSRNPAGARSLRSKANPLM